MSWWKRRVLVGPPPLRRRGPPPLPVHAEPDCGPPCDVCGGTGDVELTPGREMTCPRCAGAGTPPSPSTQTAVPRLQVARCQGSHA